VGTTKGVGGEKIKDLPRKNQSTRETTLKRKERPTGFGKKGKTTGLAKKVVAKNPASRKLT